MSDTKSNGLIVLSHIFNEEYLLPFWLEHHRDLFDHGIIIDYYSTDRSIEIINSMCPTWEIVKTKNMTEDGRPNFQAELVDNEVKEIEERINGFKICLNTTEFMMIDKTKDEFRQTLEFGKIYCLKPYCAISTNLNFFPENIKKLFRNIKFFSEEPERGHRFLHSEVKLKYAFGRHELIQTDDNKKVYRDDLIIFWLGFYPHNQRSFLRKLQIQNNIPEFDRMNGLGVQHIVTYEQLEELFNQKIKETSDTPCTNPYLFQARDYYVNKYKQFYHKN